MANHPDLRIPKSWVLSRLGTFVEWKGRTATLTNMAQTQFKEALESAPGPAPDAGGSEAQPKHAQQQPLLAAFQRAEASERRVPDWTHALSILESGSDEAICGLAEAFEAQLLARREALGPLPAYLVASLVERLADTLAASVPTRLALCSMLAAACEHLVEASAAAARDAQSTASQMAWAAARAGPAPADPHTTAAEPRLLAGLPCASDEPPELRALALRTLRALCACPDAARLLRPLLEARGIVLGA